MDNINDIFTEEEKIFLDQIQQKIMEHIGSSSNKTVEELTSFNSHDHLVHPDRITDAPTELTFVIKAVATELDENGLPKETLQVLEKFYHIPIIGNKKHNEYIDKFLSHFENKLEKTCQEMQNE
jgi:hypothetical protein